MFLEHWYYQQLKIIPVNEIIKKSAMKRFNKGQLFLLDGTKSEFTNAEDRKN
jgi:hypothetical protein